jgi:hypothetical protein
MASSSQHLLVLDQLTQAQTMLQEALASGRVPPGEEVTLRYNFAEGLIQCSRGIRQPQLLRDAVDHLETILRRVPESSPDYPKYLNKLCDARTSEYLITNSEHALDEAARAGRRALESAQSTSLQVRDLQGYLELLTNASFALSRRNAVSGSLDDLEMAIICSREIYDLAPQGSERFTIGLNNLVSQLRRHFYQGHDRNYLDEAERLMGELLSSTTPGSREHALALGQLGVMSHEKYKHTQAAEDLDSALVNCEAGLAATPTGHEIRPDMLSNIVQLYTARYKSRNEASDLDQLVRYTRLRLDEIPRGSHVRGEFFLSHVQWLQKSVLNDPALDMVERAIEDIRDGLSAMPTNFAERESISAILFRLTGVRYSLTNELPDLLQHVSLLTTILEERDQRNDHPGSTDPRIGLRWVRELASQLRQLLQTPTESPMRSLAEQELAGVFLSYHDSESDFVIVLHQVYQTEHLRLKAILTAIENNRQLSEEDINIEAQKLEDEETAAALKEKDRRNIRWPEFETELFGLRKLEHEPGSKNLAFDGSNVMRDLLGYDPEERVSPEHFGIREQQREGLAIARLRHEGKDPNVALCRMCRDLAKVLQPTEHGGLGFSAKNGWIPFGNFWQLTCRQHCTICKLILSSISTESGELLPTLAAVDDEIQGVRLSLGTLSSGEKVMRVDYGLKHVTDIRIITPQTHRVALRQSWQIASNDVNLGDRNGPIYDTKGQEVNLGLIKSWLNICDHNHGSVCNKSRYETRIGGHLKMVFIDVQDECLVSATSAEKYFALSYVWGQVNMCKTTKANVNERRELNGLSSVPFPKTIRDAIAFVRSIGERYLWTDAICMVQDDVQQMTNDIPNMDLVYGQAFATIVALHGSNADAGLPGVSAGSRMPQDLGILNLSQAVSDHKFIGRADNVQTVHLVATPRALYLSLDASTWNTRRWILQERFLSRRCLYFAPNAVYFQCNRETWSEAGTNEEYKAMIMDSVPLDDDHLMKLANHDNPLDAIDSLHDICKEERAHRAFQVYKKLVAIYTRRQFTSKADILNGFAGFFAVLERYLESETLMGLPSAMFSHALMWSPAGRIPRRGCRLATLDDLDMGAPDQSFPSWSWAGWDGPVEYRLFGDLNDGGKLPRSLIKDFRLGSRPSSKIIHEETSEQTRVLTMQPPTTVTSSMTSKSADHNATSSPEQMQSSLHPHANSDRHGGIRAQYIQYFSLAGYYHFTEQAVEDDGLGTVYWGRFWDAVNAASDTGMGPTSSNAFGGTRDSTRPTFQDTNAQTELSRELTKGLSVKVRNTGVQNSSSKQPMKESAPVDAKVIHDPSRGSNWVVMPPLANAKPWDPPLEKNILSFTAFSVPVDAFKISPEKEYLVDRASISTQSSQAVRRIYTQSGKHCGLWWEQAGYGYVGLGLDPKNEARIHMIGISEYGDVYTPRKGPSRVEGEIRLFDNHEFPAIGPGSGLINVLAVDLDLEAFGGVGSRCTVAVVHGQAWDAIKPQMKEIRIA